MYGDCQVMQQQHHLNSSPIMMIGSGGGDIVGMGMGIGTMSMSMSMNMGMGGEMSSFIPSPDPMFSSHLGSSTSSHPGGFVSLGGMNPFHTFAAKAPKAEDGIVMMRKDDEMESGSGSGQMDGVLSCGEEHDTTEQQKQQQQQQKGGDVQKRETAAKKKGYHRHTAHQIQEMEALFKECPHPDDKQRMRLSQELGLKPRQVKFWFQNRRTQMKAQQDRADNIVLRAENDSLKSENYRLQAALRNLVCPSCGGAAILGEMSFDEHHLRVENARLKEELDRLSCVTGRYGGRPVQPPPMLLPSLDLDMGIYSRRFNETPSMVGSCTDMIPIPPPPSTNGDYGSHFPMGSGSGVGIVTEQEKPLVLDLAAAAAEQLVRMCRTNEPLWVKSGAGGVEVLDVEEHGRMFQQWPMESKHQVKRGEMRMEASRSSGHVMMNSINLVDAFLDIDKWVDMFPSIVSSAKTLQVVAPGIAGYGNGSLYLMQAEVQALSPLIPTREAYFFRYCQHSPGEGFWVIVDFPADGFVDGLRPISPVHKRRPSGCIVQDMPNGYSVVTWVEQAEVEEKPLHQIFEQVVTGGAAFGAQRWLAVLQHQCDRLASLMARNGSDLGVIPSPEARKNLMRLSQRMMRTFCANISSSGAQSWTALSDSLDDTVRITTRKNADPGQPNGVILTAVSTTWLPFSHLQVFGLLTDEKRRSQLDALSYGSSLHEVAHIANGSHQKNCISLLRVNPSGNASPNVELMLQESSTHPTGGSVVVYSTIDVDAVQVAMSGEDPSYIPLLPTGFVVLPAARPTPTNNANSSSSPAGGSSCPIPTGCLLTVGLQVLATTVPSGKISLSSVTAINNHLCNAVQQIKQAIGGGPAGAMGVNPHAATASTVTSDH